MYFSQKEYGIMEGSTLDLFIKSVSKNPNHFKYDEFLNKYPLYFTNHKNEPGNAPGKKMTDLQIKERVENLGGTISEDGTQARFSFDEDVSSDNGETITLKEAVNIERQMMHLGFDGALIGTAFNEGDLKGIYFQIH